MRGSRYALAALSGVLVLALDPTPTGATALEDAERARKAVVAIRVGGRTATVGEVEARLAAIPRYQLLELGKTPDDIRKAYVSRFLEPELLLAEGADARGVARELPWSRELDRAKSSATLRAVRAGSPSASQISDAEVAAYYQEHRSFYESPERLHLFRVLFASEAEAKEAIATLKKELTLRAFTELAREKSLDQATRLRAGNLGFLGPDGLSNEAGLKADPALVSAARAVKDGELVPSPVAEGGNYAVVWRRGTVAATKRTLDEAAPQIRDSLARRKLEEATRRRVDELVRERVKERDDAPLSLFNVHVDDGPALARPDAAPR